MRYKVEAVVRLREQYRFLHFHVAFPHVFRGRADDGFSCVLGNPPWEQTQLQELEFFAVRAPEIASAPGAKRKRLIAALVASDLDLYNDYVDALRESGGISQLARFSGRYPLTGRGRTNTYALFAEMMSQVIRPGGRLGIVVPTGIATDDTTRHYFADLVDRQVLVSLFDFQNVNLFPGVGHGVMKFCLLTVAGSPTSTAPTFSFFSRQASDIRAPGRTFTLDFADFALLNPNTLTCPIFRSYRDAELTKTIYRRLPVFSQQLADPTGTWSLNLRQGLFNMTSDSGRFSTAAECEAEGAVRVGNQYRESNGRLRLPLYEAKMVHHFNHRWGDYALKRESRLGHELPSPDGQHLGDSCYSVTPKYWVSAVDVALELRGSQVEWLLGFRDIARATDERTFITSVLPVSAIGHKLPLIFSTEHPSSMLALYASMCSFVFDYVVRQKVGGTSLGFFIFRQLPGLQPPTFLLSSPWDPQSSIRNWIDARSIELVFTSWDVRGVADSVGEAGPPFRWDEARRRLLRAELDACFFHLYGIERDDADYIMETFPVVRRKDEAAFGEYRTKRLILEVYDAMAKAIETGEPYQTILDPPPADPSLSHPESTRPDWARPAT